MKHQGQLITSVVAEDVMVGMGLGLGLVGMKHSNMDLIFILKLDYLHSFVQKIFC